MGCGTLAGHRVESKQRPENKVGYVWARLGVSFLEGTFCLVPEGNERKTWDSLREREREGEGPIGTVKISP